MGTIVKAVAKDKTVQKIAIAVALHVAATNVDKVATKAGVPVEVADKIKVVIEKQAEVAKGGAVVDVLTKL